MEKWIHRATKFRGRVFRVVSGKARLDNGKKARRDVVIHVGSVAIVPVCDDCVLFGKQFRISVGHEVLEIPAGRIDKKESPKVAARRELKEELGYEAGRLVAGPSYFSSVGFLDEKVHIFLAFDLTKTQTQREDDERIEEIRLSLEEVKTWLQQKRFDDSKTIIGLRELVAYLSGECGGSAGH